MQVCDMVCQALAVLEDAAKAKALLTLAKNEPLRIATESEGDLQTAPQVGASACSGRTAICSSGCSGHMDQLNMGLPF